MSSNIVSIQSCILIYMHVTLLDLKLAPEYQRTENSICMMDFTNEMLLNECMSK